MEQIGVGDTFAGYTIVSRHSTGGMSTIYEATEPGLGRRVALKVIAPELSSDESFRERFTHEARQAAAIDHPNIIPIYGFGEIDGQLYIAMRFVVGSDLGALLRSEGGLAPERVARLVTQAASALDAVHAAGMIHRDVKPANFLVARPDGDRGTEHVYLADFGITRSESREPLTRAGEFIGTIAYASPEQLKNEPLSPASDVYALGCLTYECLTGSRPFRRDNNAAVIYAHLNDEPPAVGDAARDVPVAVDEVIAAAMAKDPAGRPASAGAFAAALQGALGVDLRMTDSGAVAAVAVPEVTRADDDEVTEIRDRSHELDRAPVVAAVAPGTDEVAAGDGPPVEMAATDRRRRIAIIATIGVAAAIVLAVVGFALAGRGSSEERVTNVTGIGVADLDGPKVPGSTIEGIESPDGSGLGLDNEVGDADLPGGEDVASGGEIGGVAPDVGIGGVAPDAGGGGIAGIGVMDPGGSEPGAGGGGSSGSGGVTPGGPQQPTVPGAPVDVQSYAATGLGEEDAQVHLRWGRPLSGGAPSAYDVAGVTYTHDYTESGCTGTARVVARETVRVSGTSGVFRAAKLKSQCSWVRWEVRAVNAAGSGGVATQRMIVPDVRGAAWPYQIIRGMGGIAFTDGNNASCGAPRYSGCGTDRAVGSALTPGQVVRIWQEP